MKYVYVLTSSEKDYYCEECIISMLSLKRNNPKAEIILLIDDKTEKTLTGFRDQVREMASHVIVEKYDDDVTQKIRSRLLKTSMRRLVKGKFLFIDSDTVIADRLDETGLESMDLGMVLDKHVKISKNYNYMYKYMYHNAKKMSYSIGYRDQHFNSGVIYVNDSETACCFFDLWHQLYLETLRKGIEIDQTALNEANCRLGGIITELGGEWNVQINCGLKYINRAKVIHYLAYQPMNSQNIYFNTLPFELCNSKYFDGMRKKGCVTKQIEGIIEHPKEAFKTVMIIPEDCVAYKLIFSNHMRILKFIYVKCRPVYALFEKIYGKIFLLVFKRV